MKKIIINTQSSIKIDNIYFDPFKIEEESHDASFIFITHSHFDHFDLDSINKVKNKNTIIVIPDDDEIKNKLDNYQLAYPNTRYEINNLIIETVPSYNVNKRFHPKDNNWLGYIITMDNERYYIMGDSDITPESMEVRCDYLFIPIGGYYTMDYKEASELTNIINPKIVFPTHFGSIVGEMEDFDKFKELVNDNIEVINKLN
ncbi:MAG: MBL fold metallo-hydrolase [Bacilli bacterium]|nr:MBL fold metallo-hydrolase [Bacilli bacterium]